MSQQQVYSEGLTVEYGILSSLAVANAAKFEPRGVNAEKLAVYTAAKTDMETKRAAAIQAESIKKQLTEQEAATRDGVLSRIGKIKEPVKGAFGKNSAPGKEFHINDSHGNSTSVVIAWAKDISKAYPAYKTELSGQGLIQEDIDGLLADALELEALNTRQEASKKLAADATKSYNDSIDKMISIADSIHHAAGLAFEKDAATLAKFEAAKKLRYEAPARKAKTPGDDTQPPPSN